jgi:hypothetical protein
MSAAVGFSRYGGRCPQAPSAGRQPGPPRLLRAKSYMGKKLATTESFSGSPEAVRPAEVAPGRSRQDHTDRDSRSRDVPRGLFLEKGRKKRGCMPSSVGLRSVTDRSDGIGPDGDRNYANDSHLHLEVCTRSRRPSRDAMGGRRFRRTVEGGPAIDPARGGAVRHCVSPDDRQHLLRVAPNRAMMLSTSVCSRRAPASRTASERGR